VNLSKLLTTAGLALGVTCGTAMAQATEGRVYAFHSTAQGGCPALDWHVVVGPNNTLSGMIAWNNMASMAKATGSVAGGKVQMTAKEVGGKGRTATVDGIVRGDGWLTVNIKGPSIACTGINIPFFTPSQSGGG
jgi:hypothetical protein